MIYSRLFKSISTPSGILTYGLVALFSCASITEDNLTRERLLSETIFNTMQAQHFAPQKIDDAFSSKAFDNYVKNLDINKRFLLQSDVDELAKFRKTIDDDITTGEFKLMRMAENILSERTKQIVAFQDELLAEPFSFTDADSIIFEYEKRKFAADKDELKAVWKKFFKYQTLIQVVQKLQANTKGTITADSIKLKLTPTLEATARESVRKSNKDFFKRLSQVNQSDRISEFVNSVLGMYDPHTDFYAPSSKENFDIQLSGRLEGIGATLNNKDGLINVAAIVPGSASSRQGQLKTNDLILKVAQDGEEAVDVTDMRLDDAIKLIRGKKGTKVILTVKKPDGSIVNIAIVRDVVIIEETFAKSTLIQGEGKSKDLTGYINLPSFYVDFNRAGGRKCSEDVKEEIKKLQTAGAKSIIFDLRNNGGGSLQDVVKIAGYFIDNGPVVQVKTRTGGVSVYDDKETGTLFDGPLVVLINPFSASASEIFAAAVQDYKRGIIMGSIHSFGKGTVQQIVDIDQIVPYQYSQYKPLGSVKLTTQKFYRINGGATQLKGVASDIPLPDIYTYLKFGEKELDNTLPWDQINPAEYKTFSANERKFAKAKDASSKRVFKNQYFGAIEKTSRRLESKQEEKAFTLNLLDYLKEVEQNTAEDKALKKLGDALPKLSIVPFEGETAADTVATARRKSFREAIAKDAYVAEAMKVISDL